MGNPKAEAAKRLRLRTGWSMMNCVRFLRLNDWDEQRTVQWLGFKPEPPVAYGTQTDEPESKWVLEATSSQQALNAGVIESYIHTGRVGSLVEINCKTGAVAQSEVFQRLAKDVAMQVCASEHLSYVSPTDISLEAIAQERTRILQSFDSEHPADDIDTASRDQIVARLVQRQFEVLPLLQQPYLRNSDITLQSRIDEVQEIVGEPIQVRRWVKFQLGASNQEPMVAKLKSHVWNLEAVYSSNSWVRCQAVAAAATFGESAVPYLIDALHDSEAEIRYRAAEILGTVGDSICVPALIQALQDPENWVRWKAAVSLGHLKDARALPALVELLQNEPGCVVISNSRSVIYMKDLRTIAAETLAEIGDSRAIEPLIQMLADPELHNRQSRKGLSASECSHLYVVLQRLGYPLSAIWRRDSGCLLAIAAL